MFLFKIPLPICRTMRNLISSFHSRLKISSRSGDLVRGKQVHAQLIRLGLHNLLVTGNQLLNCYVKCRKFNDATTLFDEMPQRNIVTWNTVICGAVNGSGNYWSNIYVGFSFFKRMLLGSCSLDHITFNGLFRGCVQLADVLMGQQLHCFVIKLGLNIDCFCSSGLIDLYGKCRLVEQARQGFEEVVCKDLVLWNVMLSTYSFNSMVSEVFEVHNLMKLAAIDGDDFSYCTMLNACATSGSSYLGKQIHCLIIKLAFDLDVIVTSALIDMYAKMSDISAARRAFDQMNARNIISWNSMIVGFGQHNEGKEALKLFREMLLEDFCPDEVTVASILSSCGSLSVMSDVLQAHAYIVKMGLDSFLSVSNGLINSYAKSGNIAGAYQSFQSVADCNLITWSSMIGAYAFHGFPRKSISIFERMLSAGVQPDKVAFLSVLSACSHGGLVGEWLYYFNLMIDKHEITPESEHYTCLVDLLGRAGLLDEALDVLNAMPIAPTSDCLAAFIGACSIHGGSELAKWATEKIVLLEPKIPVNYTVASNIHASKGLWVNAANIHQTMRNRCAHKMAACSWTEIGCDKHQKSSNYSYP